MYEIGSNVRVTKKKTSVLTEMRVGIVLYLIFKSLLKVNNPAAFTLNFYYNFLVVEF